MDINTKNALIRLLSILIAGGIGYVLWQVVPDPTVKGAAVLLEISVIGACEQIVKPQ